MIFAKKNVPYWKLAQMHEEEISPTAFRFKEILPPELHVFFSRIIDRNIKNGPRTPQWIKDENEKKTEMIKSIITRLQEAKDNGISVGIDSLVISKGGLPTIRGDGKKETIAKGGQTSYVVVECGKIAIFEPLGQPGNSTFIGEISPELEEKIQKLGRNGVVMEHIMFKVTHDRIVENNGFFSYDYNANHFLYLMEAAISHPDELLEALTTIRTNQNYSNLNTLMGYMPSTTEAVKARVTDLIKRRGISGQDVVNAGSKVIEIANEKGDDAPGLED